MYVGLQWFSPRVVALVIGIGALGNLLYLRPFRYQTRLLVPLVGTLLLSLFSAVWNQSRAILYLPFLIAIATTRGENHCKPTYIRTGYKRNPQVMMS